MDSQLDELIKRHGGIIQISYESVTLTIAGSSVAGTYSSPVTKLDDTYHVCTGVCFTEISAGGIANGQYKVALKNQNGRAVRMLPIQAVSVTKNDGTDPNKRYLETLFTVPGGNSVQLEAEIPAAPATALIVEATLRIVKLGRAMDVSSL
jgi:hypothetical protein